MAASGETLNLFMPKDAEIQGGSNVSLQKWNGVPGLVFHKEFGATSPVPEVFFPGIARRSTAASTGFTGTTGVKVIIHWFAPKQQAAGAVRWAAAFDLKGQTDLPNPSSTSNLPAYGGTNEVAANTTVNSTGGGLNVTTLSVTLANIKNGQTTAVAQGDLFRLRIRRALENAGDTLADDAIIVGVELQDY